MNFTWARVQAAVLAGRPAFGWLALLLAAAAAAGATAWRMQAQQRFAAEEQAARGRHAREAAAAAVARGPAAAPAPDFAATLPDDVALEPLLRALQRRASEQGLALVSMNTSLVDATPQTLGRRQVGVTLRGPYPGVLRLLAGLPEGDTAGAVLQRLQVQRGAAAGADVEAQFDLALYTRPLPLTEEGRSR